MVSLPLYFSRQRHRPWPCTLVDGQHRITVSCSTLSCRSDHILSPKHPIPYSLPPLSVILPIFFQSSSLLDFPLLLSPLPYPHDNDKLHDAKRTPQCLFNGLTCMSTSQCSITGHLLPPCQLSSSRTRQHTLVSCYRPSPNVIDGEHGADADT